MNTSFAKYVQLREGIGFGLSSPEAENAVSKILTGLHGAMPEEIGKMAEYLQSERGQKWVLKLVGGPSHDSGQAVHEVITTVLNQLGF